jgi:hypothetical protein
MMQVAVIVYTCLLCFILTFTIDSNVSYCSLHVVVARKEVSSLFVLKIISTDVLEAVVLLVFASSVWRRETGCGGFGVVVYVTVCVRTGLVVSCAMFWVSPIIVIVEDVQAFS